MSRTKKNLLLLLAVLSIASAVYFLFVLLDKDRPKAGPIAPPVTSMHEGHTEGMVMESLPPAVQEYPLPNAPAPTRYAKTYAEPPRLSAAQEDAADEARKLLRDTAVSRPALIELLVVGKSFDKVDATIAVDHLDPNWNNEAAQRAEEYRNSGSYSRATITAGLQYEGFTKHQALFGVNKTNIK